MIWVDYREKELIAVLSTMVDDSCLRVANLPLGDVILSDHENHSTIASVDDASDTTPTYESIWTIFERKTISDMAASIRDGRYEEQAFRLRDSPIHNHNIVYLIEGNPNKLLARSNRFSKNQLSPETMYSAFCSVLFLKGFSVYRASDLHESAAFIAQCHRKLTKVRDSNLNSKSMSKYHGLYYPNRVQSAEIPTKLSLTPSGEISRAASAKDDEPEPDDTDSASAPKMREYESIMKRKCAYTSDRGVHMAMLCQIPTVSTVIANAILDEFGTPAKLASRIQNDPSTLVNWKYSASHDKPPRRLSKNCRENIEKFIAT